MICYYNFHKSKGLFIKYRDYIQVLKKKYNNKSHKEYVRT